MGLSLSKPLLRFLEVLSAYGVDQSILQDFAHHVAKEGGGRRDGVVGLLFGTVWSCGFCSPFLGP